MDVQGPRAAFVILDPDELIARAAMASEEARRLTAEHSRLLQQSRALIERSIALRDESERLITRFWRRQRTGAQSKPGEPAT